MGTPAFAVPALERLCESGYKPVAAVTGPDKPRGRGQKMSAPPIKIASLRLGITPILQPESVRDPSFVSSVAALKPDLIVVVAFRILPPEVFTIPTRGSFNLHGSLLPRYRGAAPINRAIMAGETETGITTFFLQEKVDTGNIILTRTMPIGEDETAGEVHSRMMLMGADAVLETVRRIETGNVQSFKQDDSLATPAPKIFREDCRIDWTLSASNVHNHIRGLSPYPGAWTMYGDRLIKIYSSQKVNMDGPPGTILRCETELVIACGQGAVSILTLQQQGKKKLDVTTFLRGIDFSSGVRLGI